MAYITGTTSGSNYCWSKLYNLWASSLSSIFITWSHYLFLA